MDTNSTLSLDTPPKDVKKCQGVDVGSRHHPYPSPYHHLAFPAFREEILFHPFDQQILLFHRLFLPGDDCLCAFLEKQSKTSTDSHFLKLSSIYLFITGLIYFTGGKESFFPIAYIFSIIASSMIFYRRGALFSASLSSLLFGLLLLFQLYHWINPLGEPALYDASQIFHTLDHLHGYLLYCRLSEQRGFGRIEEKKEKN